MSAKQAGAASLGMASENFGYSRVRLRRVKKLQFGVVDPNELVSTKPHAQGFDRKPTNKQLCAHDFPITLFVIALA